MLVAAHSDIFRTNDKYHVHFSFTMRNYLKEYEMSSRIINYILDKRVECNYSSMPVRYYTCLYLVENDLSGTKFSGIFREFSGLNQ